MQARKQNNNNSNCSEYIEPKLSTREARADLNILVDKVLKKVNVLGASLSGESLENQNTFFHNLRLENETLEFNKGV